MFRARCALTVPLFRYAARARSHAAVQGRVVPQATDRLVPRFDLLLAGELSRFERHPLRDRQDASSAALTEISADNVRKRPAVAYYRGDRVDHLLRRDPA